MPKRKERRTENRKRPPSSSAEPTVAHVDEMFGEWFLDYASYVILERAVPNIDDGLKPVQRRILHSMKELEDGRYNKVANIVGNSMKYHPHGDDAIRDALIQLGQKEYLIDAQGNWGNTATGDPAAAARYIEARLSRFALEILFSDKITEWALSYDGRNREPVTLPAKFPLLLAQGADGIAVGLSTRILPHNFNEIIDGAIDALRRKNPRIFPDFPTGGIADFSEYNDGLRGGRVRSRARIEIVKKTRLIIHEIPFTTTTSSLIDSVLSANKKGRIKVSKIEDNTAENVEILIQLPPGTDPEHAVQALFAFTDCEVSISPNACVIDERTPRFLSVSELLKRSAKRTRELLKSELQIKLNELNERWHFASLERIFIQKRIYRKIETMTTWEAVIQAVVQGLAPHRKLLKRKITRDDIVRLLEIRIKRISRYDSMKAAEEIERLEDEIAGVKKNLKNLTRYAIRYFKGLKENFGKDRVRRTRIDSFDKIVAAKVAVATESLYLNAKEGFAGYGLKREQRIAKCSRMDHIIVFRRDGTMLVSKISDKAFVGKNPAHLAIFRKGMESVYSMIYRDGKSGRTFAKKFQVGGVTRNKVYDLAQGHSGTRVLYFAHQENGDPDNSVLLHLDPKSRARKKVIEFDFSTIGIKGRSARGNTVTKHKVQRIARGQ